MFEEETFLFRRTLYFLMSSLTIFLSSFNFIIVLYKKRFFNFHLDLVFELLLSNTVY